MTNPNARSPRVSNAIADRWRGPLGRLEDLLAAARQ